ncbi:hypothetical protein [Curtobacterium sp. L1-20]|uniref:hypothetical protein n=1 Tax=Curtobacterium sp. L1-20 TaxID=3138181 RepID=UPI003B52D24B
MASHRLPDEERPRRAVPAWVTAPPEDASGTPVAASVSPTGQEAHPASATSAHPTGSAGLAGAAPAPQAASAAQPVPHGDQAPASQSAPAPQSFPTPQSSPAPQSFPTPQSSPAPQSVPAPQSAPGLAAADLDADDLVVPDYPPQEDLLPPAPTSPAVLTAPFHRSGAAPAPVSPIDAAPPADPSAPRAAGPRPTPTPAPPARPVVPVVGQPRFSVPGLEHVVVEGSEPEPSGPIGYRTPARFAHQRPAAVSPTPEPTRSFDAVLAPPTAPLPTVAAPRTEVGAPSATAPTPPTAPTADPEQTGGADPRLQSGSVDATAAPEDAATTDRPTRRPAVGPTPGAVIGAVAGLVTLGLAAWWFTAPATVHGVGVTLGAIALLLSVTTLRNPAATWQRPVALLGAVLGGVGTLGLLWAVASALLPMAGVTLPDLTGTGTTPTLVP